MLRINVKGELLPVGDEDERLQSMDTTDVSRC